MSSDGLLLLGPATGSWKLCRSASNIFASDPSSAPMSLTRRSSASTLGSIANVPKSGAAGSRALLQTGAGSSSVASLARPRDGAFRTIVQCRRFAGLVRPGCLKAECEAARVEGSGISSTGMILTGPGSGAREGSDGSSDGYSALSCGRSRGSGTSGANTVNGSSTATI